MSTQKSSWVVFGFKPMVDCEAMVLKGAWDNWKGTEMRKKKDGSFYLRKSIPAGRWEYGFEGDGSGWQIDPSKETVSSPYGSLNNVLNTGE
jgi:hypothetical protein